MLLIMVCGYIQYIYLVKILSDASEWQLNMHEIVEKFGKPETDLFASRINRQLERYASWHPKLDNK